MKVNNEIIITLEPNDIKKIILEHLKEEGLIDKYEEIKIDFNTQIVHEGETLFCPGFDSAKFYGCKIVVKK